MQIVLPASASTKTAVFMQPICHMKESGNMQLFRNMRNSAATISPMMDYSLRYRAIISLMKILALFISELDHPGLMSELISIYE